MISKFKKAFTLIELMIVIAIIAILSVAFLPSALKAPAKARDAGRMKNTRDIQAAVESYAASHPGANPYGTFLSGAVDSTMGNKIGWTLPADTSSTYYYGFNVTGPVYYIGVKLENESSANNVVCVDMTTPPGPFTGTMPNQTTALPCTGLPASTPMYILKGPM